MHRQTLAKPIMCKTTIYCFTSIVEHELSSFTLQGVQGVPVEDIDIEINDCSSSLIFVESLNFFCSN